ncbi:MAG: HAMP domain-containing sensor histidine kinase [Victivallales bacterium]
MSDSNMGMNLQENGFYGNFTSMPEVIPDHPGTARTEQHSDGNGKTSVEKTVEIQRLYFNIMIHELNSFLHCIQNGIALAKIELRKDNGEVDTLEHCEKASHNSICLLRNYSMFLKGDSARLEHVKIDVVDIAKTSARMLLRDSRIIFLFGTDNTAEYVSGDETQLYQLFHNLLKNAKEAMSCSGITIRMDMSRTDIGTDNPDKLIPGEYIRIRISDSGAGIDKNNIEHLFDPYFTSKKTGMGLGLSMCMGIVENHKGAIAVDSEPGRGTAVTVLLPLIENQ